MKAKKLTRKSAVAKPSTIADSRTVTSRVRQQVRDLLTSSSSYRALPADRRREIAKDTTRVAAYLVDPHGLLTQEFQRPLLGGLVTSGTAERRLGGIKTRPDTIQMNPQALDELVQAVDFPNFVQELINGVFSAIVNLSIQQMEAYAELLAAVSKSVDEFVADNITDHSARDALVSEFPDAFCWTGTRVRRLRLHAQAGSPSLGRVAAAIGLREPVIDPRVRSELKRVVAGARRRLARNRQQTLATMILLGTNRIVATHDSVSKRSRERSQ
jgi:hypothetical protein